MAEDPEAARKRRIQVEYERARAAAEAQAAQRREQTGSTLKGIAQAGTTGLRSGSETLVGSYGDAPGVLGGAAGWLARKLGASDETASTLGSQVDYGAKAIMDPRAKIEAIARLMGFSQDTGDLPTMMPTSQDVHQALSNAYPDQGTKDWTEHVPQGAVERGVQTVGEMAPNLLFTGPRAVASAVLAPAAGAELGGAIGDRLGYEQAGRFIGGLGGSLLPGGITRSITGPVLTGERQRLAQLMGNEGIELTAGQVSGRKPLQYREVGPYDTKPGAIADQQAEQLNRAATSRTGYPNANMNPDTVRGMRDNFGNEYQNVIAQTGGLTLDPQLETDLLNLVYDYHATKALPNNAPTLINGYFDRISRAAHANGGVIPTDVFQELRGRISKSLRDLADGDPTQSRALRDLQDMMYDSIGRNSSPGVEATWRDINNRYRNFKTLEKAMMGAGESTAEGNLTPQKLRGAVQGADPQDYVAGQGGFADLARGGELFMKPLPQSGTTPRALTAGVPIAGAGAAGHAALGGDVKQALAILAGSAMAPMIPAGISSLLTSGPVREALVRRLTGQQGHFNPMASALAARQLQNEDRR